jgi:Ankyrin repeats (many copies)
MEPPFSLIPSEVVVMILVAAPRLALPARGVCQWWLRLVNTHLLRNPAAFLRDCLRLHCHNADPVAAQRAIDQFQLSAAAMASHSPSLFHGACIWGQTATAKLILEHFAPPFDPSTKLNWETLYYACMNGHLSTADFLVGRFHYTAAQLRGICDCLKDKPAGYLYRPPISGWLERQIWLADRVEAAAGAPDEVKRYTGWLA